MFEDYPDILSVEELQKILKIGKNKVYNLLQENVIKSKKIGKKYIIPKKYVINFILDIN